jgi:hypothetical protein
MDRIPSVLLGVLVVTSSTTPGMAQPPQETLARARKATAIVQVPNAGNWAGSGCCIDKSGLFVTSASVVAKAIEGRGVVRLVVDSGLRTERILPAKVLRHDDRLDLALLQVDRNLAADDLKDVAGFLKGLARSKEALDLEALELGKDADLAELADVIALGYPYGRGQAAGTARFPSVSVTRSHITSLRRDKGELLGVQIDSQLNPGSAGGPVIDSSGKIAGIVEATVEGAAMNLAIPAGRISAFLLAPALVFDPPPLSDLDRTRPVTWTIQLKPPAPGSRLPAGIRVAVTLRDSTGTPRSFTAEPAGGDTFKVSLTPLPREPELWVEMVARFNVPLLTLRVRGKDKEITVGNRKLKLSAVKLIYGEPSPRVETTTGQAIAGPIQGLGSVQTGGGPRMVARELNQAALIAVRKFEVPVQAVVAEVEARLGEKVLATIRKRPAFSSEPVRTARAELKSVTRRPVPRGQPPAGDLGLLKLGAVLDVDGVPRGAGKGIRPPALAIPPARLAPRAEPAAPAPLALPTDGRISDVTTGGGGRYLLLTLGDARKVAVFDVTTASFTKTIALPSPGALVAAGATKLVVALPDQKRLQIFDLATPDQAPADRPLPIDGRLKGLALGSDSEGPALLLWSHDARNFGFHPLRGSFVDLETATVERVDPSAHGGAQGPLAISSSGGSFGLEAFLNDRPHVRASAGGGLFGIWNSSGTPSWFFTVEAHGSRIQKLAAQEHFGYVVPGPDGRTVFTAAAGRRDAGARPAGWTEPLGFQKWPELVLPSAQSAYYLSIGGLSWIAAYSTNSQPHAVVTVSVHSAGDGARLLSLHGFEEMSGADRSESFLRDDLTIDKRFHLVPGAGLVITIPPENDRIVLRRLNLDEALVSAGCRELIVTSPPSLLARVGERLEHQMTARSKEGNLTYALAAGPGGLTIAASGRLSWAVPAGFAHDEASAVIRVGDASGQEIFQRLRIHVKGVASPTTTRAPESRSRATESLDDAGLLALGGTLDVDGTPRRAGKELQLPRMAVPAARLSPDAGKGSEPPLVRPLEGTISDVVAGGGGRYLLLALKEARKLAVFDVSAVAVVKTLPLASPNALIAAGAKKLLVAYPDEKLLERFDLATLEREGGSHVSPIDGRIRAIVMGSDSDGPALALWNPDRTKSTMYQGRFSFIDLTSLSVLKVASIAAARSAATRGMSRLSTSGGSFMLDPNLGEERGVRAYARASAGGGLFGIWRSTMGCFILQARGSALVENDLHSELAPLAPGPDGRTFLTGLGTRIDVDGKPVDRVEAIDFRKPRVVAVPSCDPAYFLKVGGLPSVVCDPHHVSSPAGLVTASVHAAGDGSRLVTVYGLDEMASTVKMEDWFPDDLTTEKRFHFVPAAGLLITVPPTNDRLVIRRLDMTGAGDQAGGGGIVVLSVPTLTATAGRKLVHRIAARSGKGGITFALADGPDGLAVSREGEVTWLVPGKLKGEDVKVVVTVGDTSGDEIFHTLTIRVE